MCTSPDAPQHVVIVMMLTISGRKHQLLMWQDASAILSAGRHENNNKKRIPAHHKNLNLTRENPVDETIWCLSTRATNQNVKTDVRMNMLVLEQHSAATKPAHTTEAARCACAHVSSFRPCGSFRKKGTRSKYYYPYSTDETTSARSLLGSILFSTVGISSFTWNKIARLQKVEL